MPTSKQRRQAAQRHLQRQLERRAEQARRRRRNAVITGAVLAVILVAGGIAIAAGVGRNGGTSATASGTSSAAATTAANGTVSCNYTKDTSGNTNLKDVGMPGTTVPTKGTDVLKMTTNQGVLTLTLNRSSAPCAAASMTYLASKAFFDGSPCHREVNESTFGVLQCGDPSGTGEGGPTYTFRQETTSKTTYPRGTIAMANTGQANSTSSQFFLCFTDTKLSPDYTAVGTIDQAGLAVLDAVAKSGNDGSFASSAGGGKPNTPVTIQTMAVVDASGSSSAPASSTAASSSAASTTAASSSAP